MIHGVCSKLFPPDPGVRYKPAAGDLCEKAEFAGLRKDLIATLKEEPAYHYGFRVAPGWNTGGIEYKHRFANGSFIQVLQKIVRELGADGIRTEMEGMFAADPANLCLAHNLKLLFYWNNEPESEQLRKAIAGLRFDDSQRSPARNPESDS